MKKLTEIARAYLRGEVFDQHGRQLSYTDYLLECSYQNVKPMPRGEWDAFYDEMGAELARRGSDSSTPIGKRVQ